MENITFQPSLLHKPILNGVTFTIEPGSKTVITGKSGSGKSAILALLSGLYQTYDGKVKVNDLSLEMINLEKYRTVVGDCLELQQIFHGTIAENILVGRDIHPDQLEFLIQLVGLKEYIYQLPEDLDTILLPEGRGLSRKLAQAIVLARAFVGDPQAMIVENGLNHMDKDVKERVKAYLFDSKWTLVMVTQDEEVIKQASHLIVMNDGNLIYQGNQKGYQHFLTLNS